MKDVLDFVVTLDAFCGVFVPSDAGDFAFGAKIRKFLSLYNGEFRLDNKVLIVLTELFGYVHGCLLHTFTE